MHWNLMNNKEFRSLKIEIEIKIEIQNGGPNKSDFLQNWFPQKLGPPSLICKNFKSLRKLFSEL